jgi:ADP-L-glycero-D-manno-heptose 6-epimerase
MAQFIVTGAAGFIGANLVKSLNKSGFDDVIAVDNLTKSEKFTNLAENKISDYMDKHVFLEAVKSRSLSRPEAVFHQGACSNTMEGDGHYMMENNYRYTLELFRWCQEQRIPFIYASSAATYGASDTFREELQYEKPLNVYGYSKFLFDQVLRREMEKGLSAPAIGLRYFNVYGPMEQHKGRMASVAFHQFHQFKQDGKVKLFEGCLGYPNGGQKRDFVYVDDVVAVNMHFLNQPVSGIYNCGTGRAQEFNDVSLTVVNTLREAQGKPQLSLEEAVSSSAIEYIPFPEALVGKYQAFTQADLTNLRDAGCDVQFKTVQEGTRLYMLDLIKRYGL